MQVEKATILRLVEKVISFAGLPVGWDSYDGVPVEARNAARAITFIVKHLKETAVIPSAVPGPAGNVQLGWYIFGIDLEIDFSYPVIDISCDDGFGESFSRGACWYDDALSDVDIVLGVMSKRGEMSDETFLINKE